jgi:hypothetical protein
VETHHDPPPRLSLPIRPTADASRESTRRSAFMGPGRFGVCRIALLVAGASSTLAWQARGATTLIADPPGSDAPGPGPERVPSRGARTFNVSRTTRFRLQARRWYSRATPAFALQEVVAVPGLRAQETRTESLYARIEACQEGRLVGRALVPADARPDAIRVTRISARAPRPLRIIHEGKMGLVLPTLDTDAFQGTPLAGEWRVELETSDGRCDHVPAAVILNATLSCPSQADGPGPGQRMTRGSDAHARR